MALSESRFRQIIKEEARRALREGAGNTVSASSLVMSLFEAGEKELSQKVDDYNRRNGGNIGIEFDVRDDRVALYVNDGGRTGNYMFDIPLDVYKELKSGLTDKLSERRRPSAGSRISENRMKRIVLEETRRARRALREGDEGGGLSFGQPEMETYEESLTITFPYTLRGETGEEKLDYSNLEDAVDDPEAVIERFAEECRHLAFQADESLEDEEAASKFVTDALMDSPDFNMERFRSDLKEVEPNRFDAEF